MDIIKSLIDTGSLAILFTTTILANSVIKEMSRKSKSDSILITWQIIISTAISTRRVYMEEYLSGKISSDLDPMAQSMKSISCQINNNFKDASELPLHNCKSLQ